MPVEPHVFLSCGRPDKGLALQISSELWCHRIECYNYLAKPVMDGLGSDGDHLKHIFAGRGLRMQSTGCNAPARSISRDDTRGRRRDGRCCVRFTRLPPN
jgi:hypothetical protein